MADATNHKEKLITRDVALIMGATFFFMAANMLGNPIIAGYSGSLGANGVMMGVVAAALTLTSLFCRPVAGNLADKTSKRVLAFAGAAIYVVADVWYACAGNELSLLLARIVNGVGFACCSVCLSTWMAMLLPISRMGAGMGLYGTMNALAQAIGPALGIKLSKMVGYRPTFLVGAALAVLMVLCVVLVRDPGLPLSRKKERFVRQVEAGERPGEPLPEAVATATEEVVENRSLADHGKPVKAPKFDFNRLFEVKVIPIALIFMMFAVPYFANQSFLVDYASDRHLAIAVSMFFPFYAIAILLLRIFMKDWFDTKSFLFFLVICTFGNLLMLLCLTVMTNNLVMLAAGIFTAFGYGLMSSVTQAQAVLIAGKERSGMANTTYYAGIDLGMSIGPLLGGVLYAGVPIQWFYVILMATMPIAWIVYAVFHRTINVPKHPGPIKSVEVHHC
ncbi:MFS transporter [Bifidobacterium choloepi]|uniref:MFS transporter n=1 Tax=Bifidobacterium choloepi TaxID=2614131 RepID=A0A6I5NI28_9BIFI|nr:MFS transporter [Bifidobacterium choloepi]NEG69993.1 MFS transporter [Bifidobacterium choloepi]